MQPSAPINDMKNVICPNCGASLSYKPGTTKLFCEHCGSSVEIKVESNSQDPQRENDLAAALVGNVQAYLPQVQVYVVKCPACGGEAAMEQNVFSSECSFCGSPITVKADARSITNPQAVLPFKLEKQVAMSQFNDWLRKLWFAPNNLKKSASSDRLNGIYLPFWTYDAKTESGYQGERGEHYFETVRQVVNGREENVRVMKTRWYPASGSVARAFDDILVVASKAIPRNYLDLLEPWDLSSLAAFDQRYLSGFKAEVSQVTLKDGYEAAKQVMGAVIHGDVCQDIGGDEQRVHSIQTQYSATTYKNILLPIWLSVYRYGDKVYRFVVNARTGEVHGERPYSAIKIILAVLAALIVLAVLIYFFGQN
jgi:DNA-directed RNA polymerase subunit RPC12/RpoP